jgi:hypothetical protein
VSADDPYAERKKLTFEQAEGLEPRPSQLRPKEISAELHAVLWAYIHESLQQNIEDGEIQEPWRGILYTYHVRRQHLPADVFDARGSAVISRLKPIFLAGNYAQIFGFLQFVLRCGREPWLNYSDDLRDILTNCRAAYTIIGDDTIVPIGSDAERETLERAFADLSRTEFHGARAHLKEGGAALTEGDYSTSVRECIHAVESVARTLAPSGKLSEALAKLEKSAAIHRGLKQGFNSIYGYTCEEQGVRHPLIDGPKANVDETDALFMIGACAAFVSYLIGKSRSAGLLN